MHQSLDCLIKGKIIMDYASVMADLDAKDRSAFDEERHPNLPDLAAGGRIEKNPEFDIEMINVASASRQMSGGSQLPKAATTGFLQPVMKNQDLSRYIL